MGILNLPKNLLTPAKVLAFGFASVIITGAFLLSLPFASARGDFTPFVDAIFTSTSAVCVTGLIVVDTATHYSAWGKGIILLLIQIGGLGYMTLATMMFVLFNKKITISDKLAMQEGASQFTLYNIVGFIKYIVKLTVLIEGTAAVVLTIHWLKDFPLSEAIGHAVFHSVSAFCNAGFSTFSSNLSSFVSDPVVNLTIAFLIILGGLGFIVLSELHSYKRGKRISLHTRLTALTTIFLLLLGTVTIFCLEYSNPDTFQPLSPGSKVLASFFSAVTPRTAGFNTLNFGIMHAVTMFFVIILMFIGASPGSTGGGIKTTSFAVVLATVWATVRGSFNVNIMGRRLPAEIVRKSLSLVILSLGLIVVITSGLLLMRVSGDFLRILFEVVSAFGTVGLSAVPSGTISLSGYFPAVGKLFIVIMMYLGRVGPLTIGTALMQSRKQELYTYAEEKILIG